jgi:hypothetical protein
MVDKLFSENDLIQIKNKEFLNDSLQNLSFFYPTSAKTGFWVDL